MSRPHTPNWGNGEGVRTPWGISSLEKLIWTGKRETVNELSMNHGSVNHSERPTKGSRSQSYQAMRCLRSCDASLSPQQVLASTCILLPTSSRRAVPYPQPTQAPYGGITTLLQVSNYTKLVPYGMCICPSTSKRMRREAFTNEIPLQNKFL